MATELQRSLLPLVVTPTISVVVPTISGREDSLARCLAAYRETLHDLPHELIVIKNARTWPTACNEGYAKAKGDILHFTADDLEPLEDWWVDALQALKTKDELPAARVFNFTTEDHDNPEDGEDGDLTDFTRVPILTRDQYERIGPWPEIVYYADLWLSWKARSIGIETRMIYSYQFLHHWSGIGRVDSRANLDRAGEELRKLKEAM